jgi:hypothetical protein
MIAELATACLNLSKPFHPCMCMSAEKTPLKNEGPSHDVDENTGPGFHTASRAHDTYDNKWLIAKSHDVTEK